MEAYVVDALHTAGGRRFGLQAMGEVGGIANATVVEALG